MAAAKILCVEPDEAVRESRCALLAHVGYKATDATADMAEFLLQNQIFDLVVLSRNLSGNQRQRILAAAGSCQILALRQFMMPVELILKVEEALNHNKRRA